MGFGYSRTHGSGDQQVYPYTVKKKIILIFKAIQKVSGAKSFMRKGSLIHEEMRKYLVIYEEAVVRYDFAPDPF